MKKAYLLLTLLVLFATACEEEEMGCRDINATNYDVNADAPCEDCCEYPVLKLQLAHQINVQREMNTDTVITFQYDSLYAVEAFPDSYFKFQRIKYYLSDVRLLKANGEQVTVIDTTTIGFIGTNDNVTLINDMRLYSPGNTSARTLGTFPYPDMYSGIQFRLGLADAIQFADPNTTDNLNLRVQVDSLNWDENLGYIANKLVYFPTPTATDSVLVNMTEPVDISLLTPNTFTIEEGYDMQLNIAVRYDIWFENIDLSTATPAEIKAHLVGQVANSFSIVSVERQ